MATKSKIAAQVRDEHLSAAAATSDADLKAWHQAVLVDLTAADAALAAAVAYRQGREAARVARLAHSHHTGPNTGDTWRQAVVAAEAAQRQTREARTAVHHLQALSALLSSLLQARAPHPALRTKRGATEPEPCPFCEHTYTVRDGLSTRTDADGVRMQLRKCQCREMAPPCKNCPVCKVDAATMAAEGAAQAELCRNELRCQVCACECPGQGKWVEGDEVSRNRFKERTAKRHSQLSSILQTSWTDGGAPSAEATSAGPPMALPRRLPADIKQQIEAVAAAQSLQCSAGGSAAPEPCVTASEAAGERRKRRRTTRGYWGGDEEQEELAAESGRGRTYAAYAMHAGGSHHHCHHHDQDHAAHQHRCTHPHNECTSDCCSEA